MQRQLRLLFLSNLLVFTVGNGLLPLLPVYANKLGADPALIGRYMAFTSLMLAIGVIAIGRLARKLKHTQRLFVILSMIAVISMTLLGQIHTIWQLIVLTSVAWFCGGGIVALVNLLTGLIANNTQRGRAFGLLYLALPLGSLIGGLSIGRLADWKGYGFLFTCLGLVWAGVFLIGLFGLHEEALAMKDYPSTVTGFAPGFYLLVGAAILSAITVFVGRLGTSLSMQSLGFRATAITSTAAVSGLVTIPAVQLFSRLSDRYGRQGFIALCYLFGGAGMLLLVVATKLWHFWFAAAGLSMTAYVATPIASALATDLLPPEALKKGLPLLTATTWIGGIVGFTTAGYLIDRHGTDPVYLVAAALAAAATLCIALMSKKYVKSATSLEATHG